MDLNALFLTVLRMSLTGSFAILAVMLLRLGLKKAPKIYSYLLWAVVLLRLLTPFGIPMEVSLPAFFSELSLGEAEEDALPGYAEEDPALAQEKERSDLFPWYSDPFASSEGAGSPGTAAGTSAVPVLSDPAGPAEVPAEEGTAPSSPVPEEPPEESVSPAPGWFGLLGWNDGTFRRVTCAAACVWIAGAAVMIFWNLVSCVFLKRKLREAVPVGERLYETDRVDTAFVFGLFSPRVYLPAGLGLVERACVAEHERTHIKRGDPFWRVLAFTALTVHWFNPLVWLAFRSSGKDMEMSCDEAVLKRASVDIRAAYSKTLVRFASRGRSAGPVLAFGEGETGSRVKNVMKYKKPLLRVSVAAGIVLAAAAVLLAVNLIRREVSLPYSRFSVDGMVSYSDERTPDMVERLRFEIGGDGSVWTTWDGADGWDSVGTVTPVSTKGLTEFVREQTGAKIGRITAAARRVSEGSTGGWLFFVTSSGDVYAASIGTERGAIRSVGWICRLKNEFPYRLETSDGGTYAADGVTGVSGIDAEYVKHSLAGPVGRDIETVALIDPGASPYVVAVFATGLPVGFADEFAGFVEGSVDLNALVRYVGIAVFEAEGNSARLVNWALAEEAGYAGIHPEITVPEESAGGTFRFALSDGRILYAEVNLPVTKRTLFGVKTVKDGDLGIGFRVEGGTTAIPDSPEPTPQAEQTLEQPDGGTADPEKTAIPYDEFVAAHYDPDNWITAVRATRRIDLDRDGTDELVVYRLPALSGYPLDIYVWDRSKKEIRAFSTTVKDVPASLNALPGGTFTAEIGVHDPDKPDGFYGDFFSVNGQTYLISKTTSDSYIKFECYAFSQVRGSLAAAKIFSAEWFGEWYADENRRKNVLINGVEIPYEDYGDALLAWRSSWNNVPGGGDVIIWSEPLWNESEVSGWPLGPLGWKPPLSVEDGTGILWTAPDGLFTLTLPKDFPDDVSIEADEYWESGSDYPGLWVNFSLKTQAGENGAAPWLGALVLYPHQLERFYPTGRQEYKTVTYQGGNSFEFVLVLPGDIQYTPETEGLYTLRLMQLRDAAHKAKFPEDARRTVSPGKAAEKLGTELITAYENTFGHAWEPLGEDPSPCPDEEYLRYAINRILTGTNGLKGAWEDEEFYWYPVIFPFAVDKENGDIYKVCEGWYPETKSGYTHFEPFDPAAPDALSFAG